MGVESDPDGVALPGPDDWLNDVLNRSWAQAIACFSRLLRLWMT
jgi:hypothetical protein